MAIASFLRRLAGVGLLALLTACQVTEVSNQSFSKTGAASASRKTTKPASAVAEPDTAPTSSGWSKIFGKTSNPTDARIEQILELARKNQWESAEAEASALYALTPRDPSVQRIYSWVKTEGPKRREKMLEDRLRDITSSKDVGANPTVKGVLTDNKSRGLPPRTDLREAIDQLKATPYIPETFGKSIESKGTLEDFDSQKARMSTLLDKEISVQLDNVTLESLIFNLGQAEGINFIADKALPAFQQKLSVNLKNVKLSEFLRYVSRNLDIQFQIGPDLIWIVDGKDPKKILEETRFYRLKRGFLLPAQFGATEATRITTTANNVTTISETQKYDNFVRDAVPRMPAIENAIKQFFEGSKTYIDYERNVIVARGTYEQLRVMDKIIEEFDKPVQQVMIEARFITVTEGAFLQLGVAWETGAGNASSGNSKVSADRTGILGALGGNVGTGLQNTWRPQDTWTNILGWHAFNDLSATLSALEQSGESQTLSAPRITVINNLPAEIQDGRVQYYYEQYTVTQTITERRSSSSLAPLGKPTKFDSGVKLYVLASVGGDGKSIILALNPEVIQDPELVPFISVGDRDDAGKIVNAFTINLPTSINQTIATRVVVKSGQTVALGGVITHEQRTFVESVPILSNIPLIGAAFRRRTEVDKPRYLLIFVTATLLSESGEYIVSPEAE